MSLKDAVSNLNAKIAASASGATAEEVAYLATAAERIGGRVSIFELAEFADDKKAELAQAASNASADAIAALDTLKGTRLAEIDTERDRVLSAIAVATSDSKTAIAQAGATAQATMDATKKNAIDAVNGSAAGLTTLKTSVEQAITSAKDSALSDLTAAAAAVVANGFGQRGRLSFYTTF